MLGDDPMMDAALDDIMKAIRLIAEEPATDEQFKRDVLRAGLFKFAASLRRNMS